MRQEPQENKPFFNALLNEENTWPLIMRRNAGLVPKPRWENVDEAFGQSLEQWLRVLPDSLRQKRQEGEFSFFWNYSEDSRKIALLEDAHLEQLAVILGVTFYAPDFSRIVERSKLLECRKILGEDLLNYAQMRGQFYTGEAGRLFVHYDEDLPLTERALLHGWLALQSLSLAWPQNLTRSFQERLSLLSSKHGISLIKNVTLKDSDRKTLWRLVKKCLLREVAPEWAQYFST